MYLIPFTTSIEVFFKHNDHFNSVKKKNNIKNQSDFSFLCTMHIYLKYLNKLMLILTVVLIYCPKFIYLQFTFSRSSELK